MENVVELPDFVFHSPTTICISGSTSSGKTYWMKKAISQRATLFECTPEKVVYFYGIWQDIYNEMEGVEFVKGLPSDIESYSNDKAHSLWIIDDLMSEVVNNKATEDLFTRGSHHMNVTVVYINQNIFCQGKSSRTIALNTHYNILFRNPRDIEQIQRLDRQIGMKGMLKEAYLDAVSSPYGYLLLDLSPHNNTDYRLWSKVFCEEDHIVYI